MRTGKNTNKSDCGSAANYNKGCKCRKCKDAWNEYTRIRRSTPEGQLAIRNMNLLKFGITADEYDEMHRSQDGVCAICGKPEEMSNQYGLMRLAVDHNHETGKVRGLLCMKCNRSLGMLGEDIGIMRKMIEYIKEKK